MEQRVYLELAGLQIGVSVMTTWGIMALLALLAWLITRNLQLTPSPVQTLAESIFTMIENAVLEVAPDYGRQIVPFIATIWLFLIVANLASLIPPLHSPTDDLSVTSALAILVFLSVHWFGIKTQGLKNYLRHYLQPSPILLPFHIISEFTRTLALAIRLFGNMMSLETAAMLVLLVAGFLAPIPILMLHIIEALVQAYIFGMLALIYLASAIQTQHSHPQE